jgi:hypothetical protein
MRRYEVYFPEIYTLEPGYGFDIYEAAEAAFKTVAEDGKIETGKEYTAIVEDHTLAVVAYKTFQIESRHKSVNLDKK